MHQVIDLARAHVSNNSDNSFKFRSDVKSFICEATSSQQKDLWMHQLREAIANMKNEVKHNPEYAAVVKINK